MRLLIVIAHSCQGEIEATALFQPRDVAIWSCSVSGLKGFAIAPLTPND